MVEARGGFAWSQTSLLASIAVNSAPFRKGSPVKPDAFNPYARRSAKPKPTAMIDAEDLRHVFCK